MSTHLDIAGPALCAWRENAEGGRTGMQSVLNVLSNRSARDNTSLYAEAVKRFQFSSMATLDDPGTVHWPAEGDPLYAVAELMAQQELDGQLPDITNGAVDYYAPGSLTAGQTATEPYALPDGTQVKFPKLWNPARYVFEAEIQGQLFFKETTA